MLNKEKTNGLKKNKTKLQEQKESKRNRYSFLLTLFSFYFTLLSFHLTAEELIITQDKQAFKYFIYSSVISLFLVICSLLKFISPIFLFNSVILYRLGLFIQIYIVKSLSLFKEEYYVN